jgi:YD repeat-containing protein
VTDRKGQVSHYQYDEFDRLSLITYADASTTQYTYDAGDRLTQIVDSDGPRP